RLHTLPQTGDHARRRVELDDEELRSVLRRALDRAAHEMGARWTNRPLQRYDDHRRRGERIAVKGECEERYAKHCPDSRLALAAEVLRALRGLARLVGLELRAHDPAGLRRDALGAIAEVARRAGGALADHTFRMGVLVAHEGATP